MTSSLSLEVFPLCWNDGGRREAGYRGETGDCVVRAICIATGQSYRAVYEEMARGNLLVGRKNTARLGTPRSVYEPVLKHLGWTWVPTMAIGTGCRVHLRPGELPTDKGPLIVRLSRHLTVLIDGVIHDTHDPARDGSRCVYGWWYKETR